MNRVRHKDGSWRWIETVSTNELENPNVRGIVANFRDVTDRRRIEEALHQREEHFRLIVESATDFAIFTLGLEGRIISWNAGAERILGFSEDEILGSHVSIIFTPEDNAAGRAEFEMRGAVHDGHENDDRWHVKKGGARFWANGIMMPLKNEEGKIKGYLKILRDRTEQHIAGEALKDADRRKDELLAMLSHELRNPLAAIQTAVHLLLRSGSEENLDWIKDVVDRQSKKLARLVDDLLDASRITRGAIQLRMQPIDLAVVIARAVEAVRPLAREKGLELSSSIAPGALTVTGDATRLEQVVLNLLTNAVNFTENAGHITLTASRDTEAVVTVKDDGIGIRPELLPHIFDLFVQADQTRDRSHGGLGVGLTLVKKLVEMHGGTVTATSDGAGKGSEFTFRIPAVAEPVEDRATPRPARAEQPPRGLHVLVADDNDDTVAGMTRLLEASGYRVTTARDGPAALESARAQQPDIILMDIGLPGIDGYNVADQLRREKGFDGVTMIAISGYGQEQDRYRSRESGFDHHLVKPVDFDSLLSLLSKPNSTLPRSADERVD